MAMLRARMLRCNMDPGLSIPRRERGMTDGGGVLLFPARAGTMRDIVMAAVAALANRAMDRDPVASPGLGDVTHAVGDRDHMRDLARAVIEIDLADAGAHAVFAAVPRKREVGHRAADLLGDRGGMRGRAVFRWQQGLCTGRNARFRLVYPS